MQNDAEELERFKVEVNLSQFAAGYGYQLRKRESSRNSAVMKNLKGDKIIVAREGQHWIYFSVRDDSDSGSVIDFLLHREAGGIGRARQTLRQWIDYTPTLETCTRDRAAIMRQFSRLQPVTDHTALAERGINATLLELPRFARCVFRDHHGNACFPHFDTEGIAGWEIKNRGFTGYAKGGTRRLWFSRTTLTDLRLVIAESALDALSYAALFPDDHARYFSTGGSLNPNQPALIARALAKMPTPAIIVLATDNDPAGHALAATIQALAPPAAEICRPLPAIGKDWNDQLQAQDPTPQAGPHKAAPALEV